MRRTANFGLALLAVLALAAPAHAAPAAGSAKIAGSHEEALLHTKARLANDVAALEQFRPGYSFWQWVFLIPDGSVVFGSAEDGRLLARFPVRGDWRRDAFWEDRSLAPLLGSKRLPTRLHDRRDQVARLFEPSVGPVVHNPTRGGLLLPNVPRYGSFLSEWAAIYERFGVPWEIGLAQALVESGLSGTIKSEARAVGFCQWLPRNWDRLKRLSPHVIEWQNQTTQAPYCAAYLTVLSTKYGSFVPALSEHHAGVINVGRTVINGFRLGGQDIREQYFLGSEFARDLSKISARTFRQVIGTYGPRSFRYAEMVFGNTLTVRSLRDSVPQDQIFAIRAERNIPLTHVAERTGLPVSEIRRFNPALIRQVPKGANLYLPVPEQEFGPDVAFWHRPAPPAFSAVLYDFVRLETSPQEWEDPAFDAVLRDFRRRFGETETEEGDVMSTVLAYVLQEIPTIRRILSTYRNSSKARRVFEQGVARREQLRLSSS